jgi:hypothetical protein
VMAINGSLRFHPKHKDAGSADLHAFHSIQGFSVD